ncbi:MAG: type III-B CRISPR-associated protein Cas10/Cmr2 [Thermomicrobium sp.]|nr:type III-B CRISPR-associated protein Cas10/Cmr2 [Thermomicrobium sp.]
MNDAVLRFTFGPVQPFIAEARRTSDLFAGSRILAELARAAVRALQQDGAQLVYPADLSSDPPNVIVARVPWSQAEASAQRAAQALRDRWLQFADEALQQLARLVPLDEAFRDHWQRQTADPWELYWAAAPIERDDYATAFRRATAAVAALKKTRTFDQQVEAGPKDALSGTRAALARAGEDPRSFWRTVRRRPEGARLVGEHERLDAVSAVKRFFDFDVSFPSLPTIAARPFVQEAVRQAPQALETYRDAFDLLVTSLGEEPRRYRRVGLGTDRFPYDGSFLYEATLEWPALLEELGLEPSAVEPRRATAEGSLRRARHALTELVRAVGRRPSRYVAVLVLDGDSMGRWLSEAVGTGGEAAHRAISQRLAAFAARAKELVENRFANAAAVYLGGDDVVALVPAEEAVPLALALAEAFHRITEGRTASAGIAIAHWLEPLGDLLRAARAAERAAKRLPRKRAVAVELQPRGGEIVRAVAEYEWLKSLQFEDLVERFRRDGPGSLSGRVPTDLRLAARVLPRADEAFRAVLARSVTRQGHWPAGTVAERDRLVERLHAFARAYDALRDDSAGAVPEGPAQLADWLALARFLARGGGE